MVNRKDQNAYKIASLPKQIVEGIYGEVSKRNNKSTFTSDILSRAILVKVDPKLNNNFEN